MPDRLRQVIVPIAAAVIVFVLLVVTGVCLSRNISSKKNTSESESSMGITMITSEALEGDARISETESVESEEIVTSILETETSSQETETETLDESVEETTEEAEEVVGLASYFQNKLILDPEKVELYLNVREAGDEEAKILSVMYPNDILPYIDHKDGWYEVQCDGYTGFVNDQLVLTDNAAYECMKHYVGYAVMAKEDSVFLYVEPDDTGTIIIAAAQGEAFRVIGQYGSYYKVSVISPIYDYLYVLKKDVALFYLFLSPGNINELDEETETYLHSLNLNASLEKCELIMGEVEERQRAEEEYKAYLASVEAEEEEERKAKQEAAELAASRAEESWAASHQSQGTQAASTSESGGTRYLGVFTITNYCHCQICCGVWGSNDPNYVAHGSSGQQLIDNYSLAVDTGIIPFGAKIMINGQIYLAADSGVHGNVIDIYHRLHEDALSYGCYVAEVYIVE